MITLRGQILVSRIGDDPPPPPCVHPKRFPCLRSKRSRVYRHQAHMFPTPNTHHDHQRHHHHNDTHHITQHGDRNRESQRKRDKTRQEKTRQDKKAREEKREEEERRRREKKKEKMNRDKQFFRECPSAPQLFSHQIPENVQQGQNYLAQMSEMSASTGIN